MQLGIAVGTILAEQHTRIVAHWLPPQPAWPEPPEWVCERLGSVVDDSGLIAVAEAVMGAYDSVVVAEADRTLVHTDNEAALQALPEVVGKCLPAP